MPHPELLEKRMKAEFSMLKVHVTPSVFVHPMALVDEGARIGEGTRIWAFSHLVSGTEVGADCNICDHVFIEGKVRVGNRVTIKCGVQLWEGVTVEDDCFIGPNATFSNDLYPRSKRYPPEFLMTVLKKGCSVGANATILPGIIIGQWAMVGAGAVVTKSVPDHAIVVGNPARRTGWVCSCGLQLKPTESTVWKCECGQCYCLTETDILRRTE